MMAQIEIKICALKHKIAGFLGFRRFATVLKTQHSVAIAGVRLSPRRHSS